MDILEKIFLMDLEDKQDFQKWGAALYEAFLERVEYVVYLDSLEKMNNKLLVN